MASRSLDQDEGRIGGGANMAGKNAVGGTAGSAWSAPSSASSESHPTLPPASATMAQLVPSITAGSLKGQKIEFAKTPASLSKPLSAAPPNEIKVLKVVVLKARAFSRVQLLVTLRAPRGLHSNKPQ
jgi:hypothetical protein